METKSQIKLLIISCLVILIGLVAIQYYLIRNTYNLTKDIYITEVKKNIKPVVDASELDSLEDVYIEKFKILAQKKITDSISPAEFQSKLNFLTDSVKHVGNLFLQSQLKDYPILSEINLRYQLSEVVFSNNGVVDTLLKLTEPSLVFIGKAFDAKNVYNVSSGTVRTNHQWDRDNPEEKFNVDYNYSHLSSVDMEITNFEQKIWKKMLWMLVAAVFLIFAVIFLFFWMYRSLIKQKKIAEVKTDFANNITHELKTPLTSLNLIVKSFQNEEIIKNPEAMKQLTQTMGRQNSRIQNIFDRVLESSVEQQKVHWERIDIVQFLTEFMMDYPSETHPYKIDIAPVELFVETDSYQLGRVLQNLLQNAEKYSPEAREIQVKSFVQKATYTIEILDFGTGIPTAEQKKIFEKFYRVSQGNLHNVKGLGLGLYLSKQIMESLNGTIEVQSSLDKGSVFTVKIPLI